MSEYQIPFHIQEDIMKRLPVKSLIRFRSVSKAWKSLIDSPKFIVAHNHHRHTQPHHLLLWYRESNKYARYLSYVDDVTFPQQMSILTVPQSIKQLHSVKVIGCSHGLICLYGYDPGLKNNMVVLWNPSIRKSILVEVPSEHFVSFGGCHVTTDPKIVAIKQSWDKANMESSYRCEVMVYTLSSGNCRSLSTNLPTIPLREWGPTIATKQFIYWRVESGSHNMIMSFDLTHENFEGIDLPDGLPSHELGDFHMSKIKESLAMIEYVGTMCTVWMLEDAVDRSFTKLYNIITLSPKDYIVGFRKKGTPIMLVTKHDRDDDDDDDDYVPPNLVYEPNSNLVYERNYEHNNVIEISGSPHAFKAHSYMETLLLLGRSDCIS